MDRAGRMAAHGRAFPGTASARTRWSILAYVEKVRTQFLSLRQIAQGRVFSGRTCWHLSPVTAAISHLNSGLLLGRARLLFSKRLFISEALDSADSIRFSKIQRFEGPIDFSEKKFCGSSRIGEGIRFQFVISRFSRERGNGPEIPAFRQYFAASEVELPFLERPRLTLE
jgi:hypothetical protein